MNLKSQISDLKSTALFHVKYCAVENSADILAEQADEAPYLCIGLPITIESITAAADGQQDPNRNRTITMAAYTGGLLNLPNYPHPVIVDLQGMSWPTDKIPLKVRHGKDVMATIGQTSTLTNDGRQLSVAGFIAPVTDDARHLVGMSDRGFQWQASIEAKLRAPTQFVQPGQTVTVNGQTFTGPVFVAPRTLLTGIGIVEIGADSHTSAVVAASLADSALGPQGGSNMNFEQWCQANGLDPSTMDAAQMALAKALYSGSTAEGATPMEASAIQAALGAVRAGQQAAGAAAGAQVAAAGAGANPDPNRNQVACSLELLASLCGNHPTIEASAIEGNWTEQQVRRAVRVADLRVQRPEGRLPPVSFTNAERQLDATVIEASLLLASGLNTEQVGHAFTALDPQIPQARREQVINCALARDNRITSFSGVFRRLLHSRGRHAPDSRHELFNEVIYASQHGDLDIEAAGGETMVNLPGIFGNVMNKRLLAAYEELPSVIPEFCRETDADDFKTQYTYRLAGIGGEMYELGSTGELKTVSFTEESYTNRLKTRGFMLTLPRELIINDDLRAMDQITNLIGRNARRTRERIGFRTLLRAWSTLFTTGHGNYLSSATYALNANGDAVRAAITKFTKQKDASGDPIMIAPDRILTGTTLAPLADDLYTKDSIQIAGTTDKTVFVENRVKSKLRPISSPFMDPGNGIYATDDSTDVGSDTKWIALCDPRLLALVEFVYLSGKRSPTVETRADASFNTLGMSWRCFWDINASTQDYRAGVGADGA